MPVGTMKSISLFFVLVRNINTYLSQPQEKLLNNGIFNAINHMTQTVINQKALV